MIPARPAKLGADTIAMLRRIGHKVRVARGGFRSPTLDEAVWQLARRAGIRRDDETAQKPDGAFQYTGATR